jgi:hypothetical protein
MAVIIVPRLKVKTTIKVMVALLIQNSSSARIKEQRYSIIMRIIKIAWGIP